MEFRKINDKNLFRTLIILIFILSILFFNNIKYGSFTGISSSYLKLEKQIEKNNNVNDIFYKYKPIKYISQDLNLTNYKVESYSPYLPDSNLNEIIPSGYFLIDENGTIGSKYPFYFSYISFFFKKTLNIEVFYLISYLSILFILLFALILKKIFQNYYVIWGIFSLLTSSILLSLFTGRFIREISSLLFVYTSYYFFYRYYRDKKWKYFYYGSIILGLATSLRITNIIISLPIIILLYKKVFNKKFLIKKYKNILIGFFLFIIGLIPFLYQLLYPIINLKKIFLPISGNINGITISNLIIKSNNIKNFNWLILFKYSISGIGFLLITIILLYIILKFKKEKNKEKILSFMSIYISFLILFGSWVNPWPRYILNSIPILFIIFIYSFQKLFSFKKINNIILILIFIIASLNTYTISTKKVHYWSEISDESIYKSIKYIDNITKKNSLIIFKTNHLSDLGNQNIRGYIDSINNNIDLIGIKNLNNINNFYIDLNKLKYDNLYLLTEDIIYEKKFKLIYNMNLNSSNLKRFYYLYEIKY